MPKLISYLRYRKLKRIVRRILIIYWGFYGDVLTTTPLLKALAEGFPGSRTTYLLGKMPLAQIEPASKLLQNNPYLDKWILSDVSVLRKIMLEKPYDLVLDLCAGKTSGLVARLSAAKVKVWGKFRKIPRHFFYSDCLGARSGAAVKIKMDGYRYRAEQFLKINDFLGIRTREISYPKIYLSPQEKKYRQRFFSRIKNKKDDIIIGIHPGGRVEIRLWGAANYALLIDRLAFRTNFKIILFYYAFGEKELISKIRFLSRHKPLTLSEKDLRKYVVLASGCDVFIGSDGGPLHMALAGGAPCVGIFKNRANAEYWYDYKNRPGLFSVFTGWKESRPEKEVGPVLEKIGQALEFKNKWKKSLTGNSV